ncbi:MAG: hypothetical protein RLY31_782 [Bacteroidota bacterium]
MAIYFHGHRHAVEWPVRTGVRRLFHNKFCAREKTTHSATSCTASRATTRPNRPEGRFRPVGPAKRADSHKESPSRPPCLPGGSSCRIRSCSQAAKKREGATGSTPGRISSNLHRKLRRHPGYGIEGTTGHPGPAGILCGRRSVPGLVRTADVPISRKSLQPVQAAPGKRLVSRSLAP